MTGNPFPGYFISSELQRAFQEHLLEKALKFAANVTAQRGRKPRRTESFIVSQEGSHGGMNETLTQRAHRSAYMRQIT